MPPRGHLATCGDILAVITGGWGATGIQWVQARDVRILGLQKKGSYVLTVLSLVAFLEFPLGVTAVSTAVALCWCHS